MCLSSHRSGKPSCGSAENRENQMSLILALIPEQILLSHFCWALILVIRGHMHVTLHFCDLIIIWSSFINSQDYRHEVWILPLSHSPTNTCLLQMLRLVSVSLHAVEQWSASDPMCVSCTPWYFCALLCWRSCCPSGSLQLFLVPLLLETDPRLLAQVPARGVFGTLPLAVQPVYPTSWVFLDWQYNLV